MSSHKQLMIDSYLLEIKVPAIEWVLKSAIYSFHSIYCWLTDAILTKSRTCSHPHKTLNLIRKTNTEQIITGILMYDKYVKSSEGAHLSSCMNLCINKKMIIAFSVEGAHEKSRHLEWCSYSIAGHLRIMVPFQALDKYCIPTVCKLESIHGKI